MTKARDLANASTALSAVSATELGYVDGVTSAIQTQLDAKLASSTAATTYVANSLADAKGDLFVASADNTVTRLPVGSTGDTIVADSSTATGLRYQANFAAGKNKVINGDFGIWQRGTSLTATNSFFYTADRWLSYSYGASATTVSQQTFTPGTAPVAGYEGQYFARITSSATQIYFEQRIEDVRTFAGQTVTFSFWAKQATGAAAVLGTTLVQVFGSGGSATVSTSILSGQTTTTGWTRFTGTATLPSISGKTIGTNSYLSIQMSNGSLNNAFDIWGVQLESGSVATAFQTASGGSPQAELAMCQRYYYRSSDSSTNFAPFVSAAISSSSTQADCYVPLPVTMRTKLASVDFANLSIFDYVAASGYAISNVVINSNSSPTMAVVSITFSTATAGRFIIVRGNNSSSAYLGFSAEL